MLGPANTETHSFWDQVLKKVEVAIHVLRRHVCVTTLRDNFSRTVRMIASIDQKISGGDVEMFVHDIEVHIGEGKGLSYGVRKTKG